MNPPGAVEAVMAKVEERLPLTFGVKHSVQTEAGQRQAMYKILYTISAGATNAIWRHENQSRVHDTGTSSCIGEVTGKFSDMEQATAAWHEHYAQRMTQGCQRRNRLIEEAVVGTASELSELFAELDYTTTAGFDATAMAVADEAGDVWYGAQCYARAYTEQAARAVAGWKDNAKADSN